VQITGFGDFTKMNIAAGDEGGELDPHGADGNGNPIGALVFSEAFGALSQVHEWTNFMSATQFCIRACKAGPDAWQYCNHIYDVMGCDWVMPGNYADNVLETCVGDSDLLMGIYVTAGVTSTFNQGDAVTPDAHPAASSSDCTTVKALSDAVAPSGNFSSSATTSANSTSATSTPVSTTTSLITSTTVSGTPSTTSGSSSLPAATSAPASSGAMTIGSSTLAGLFAALSVGTLAFA